MEQMGNSDIMRLELWSDNGKRKHNDVTGTEEAYREFGPQSRLWIPWERFESWARAMM